MTEQAADWLDAFCAPQADPLFWRPPRLGVPSAWYGHIPFAFWLVAAIRPRLLVELGTHAGVSYAAFCEAVVRCRLPTRCFAVDSWLGDQHSGHYGEEVYADFHQFNDQHFRAFSTLLRMDFDAAREQFADGTIDLLHIDGEHTYEAVSHDFETWRRKLSDRAVVVFHDTIVRERDFGVWRLWHELTAQHPGFEFFHGSGLGVLAIGPDVPAPLNALLRAEDGVGATIRDRFARLGDGWEAEARSRLLAEEVARVEAQFRAKEAQFRAEEAQFRAEEAQFRARLSAADGELSRSRAEAAGLGDSLSTATAELRAAALQETERQGELRALRRVAGRCDTRAARGAGHNPDAAGCARCCRAGARRRARQDRDADRGAGDHPRLDDLACHRTASPAWPGSADEGAAGAPTPDGHPRFDTIRLARETECRFTCGRCVECPRRTAAHRLCFR